MRSESRCAFNVPVRSPGRKEQCPRRDVGEVGLEFAVNLASEMSTHPSRIPLVAVLAVASVLLFAVTMFLLWRPVLDHYRVDASPVTTEVMAAHTKIPSDEVLSIVADVSMMTDHPLTGKEAVSAADRILRGELALPALPVLPIEAKFAPEDLERGVPVQQVWIASLIVPDLLLRAYEETRSSAYLEAARIYIENFCRYESRRRLPVRFLWNAHAVVNRVAVMSRFWKAERGRLDANSNSRTTIHAHITRLGMLLSKPEHFIGATNHGVMQNVALLQIATAFPSLPEAQRFRELALERLAKQIPFYLSSEGAVLEHSAGYHFHGVVVTGFILRLLEAAGHSIPPQIANLHESAAQVLRDLQRPDATLPLIGNTYRYEWTLPKLLQRSGWAASLKERDRFSRLYPIAGYAVWFEPNSATGESTHAVVPWGYFVGHGHSRAQEMSLSIWADGTDWSTNSGYWPSDDEPGIMQSNGWAGSNAPHVVGESLGERKTTLMAFSHRDDVRFLDLERRAASGAIVRRQILQVGKNDWIALDTYSDTYQRSLRTIWTAAPESQVESIAESPGMRRYEFHRDDRDTRLSLTLLGPADLSAEMLRGSSQPFGGWVAHSRKAHPAPSVDARIPHSQDRWMLAALKLHKRDESQGVFARMDRWRGPESWAVVIPDQGGLSRISREEEELLVSRSGPSPFRFTLSAPPNVEDERLQIAAASKAVRDEFPRVRLYEPERTRVSMLLAATWLVMLVICGICWHRRYRPLAAWLTLQGGWLCGAFGLMFFYLQ